MCAASAVLYTLKPNFIEPGLLVFLLVLLFLSHALQGQREVRNGRKRDCKRREKTPV